MKPTPLIVALASILAGGCYTQLPLVEEDSPAVQETQPAPDWYPGPIIIVVPVFGTVPTAVPISHPTPVPRPIGVIRSGSSASDRAPASPDVRTTGSTRGGR